MTAILIKSSGIRIGGRKRPPDMDHATTIWDHARRGYTLNVNDDGESLFSISIMRFADDSFSNQPEGTHGVLRVFINYGIENAALYDEPPIPAWVTKLDRLIRQSTPPGFYISSNIYLANSGDTNG